jgi:hypothetical protein
VGNQLGDELVLNIQRSSAIPTHTHHHHLNHLGCLFLMLAR